MLKWTASTQRLHELPAPELRAARRQRRQRRATIANKENVPSAGYNSSTPQPLARLRNSPLVLAPLSDIRNLTPETESEQQQQQHGRRVVQSVRYAATLPRYEEEYSPSLPSGQHLALRGLLPLDPFLEQPRYMEQLKKRKLEADFLATMEQPVEQPAKQARVPVQAAPRPVTPQPSTNMGDQTLDRLIDAILDSACKPDPCSQKKKPRKSFNLRRRTLLKQQQQPQQQPDAQSMVILSPSYAPGDDPASDLSFALLPLPATPEPVSHSVLVQLPTPQLHVPNHSDTFCLATPTPVRPLKRCRERRERQPVPAASVETPPKRLKVDARNYFEVGLALPSIYV
ncbi:PREDICTED: uncharacterized protein LOC108618559 [Drosophila arizonae]|uniref:Uncharacterized protein LOC108618559 n=1 Tax=Drosophila arizonae TaxID=7263 RepID=A0ABM1PSC0_DROAR|nr:PREDICTED: uncharacterized protein LOC108618559 [Drosophila arizonae]